MTQRTCRLCTAAVLAAALSLSASAALAQNAPAPAAQASTAPTPAASQAAAVRAAGLWIDVRTPEEYAQGHLQDAPNLPLADIAQRIASVAPDKSAPIHLYCRTGRRAGQARDILLQMGYTNVTNQGGYEELVQKGIR